MTTALVPPPGHKRFRVRNCVLQFQTSWRRWVNVDAMVGAEREDCGSVAIRAWLAYPTKTRQKCNGYKIAAEQTTLWDEWIKAK